MTPDTLTPDQRLIYEAMLTSVSRKGMTNDAIRRKVGIPKTGYYRVRSALQALCDVGLMEWSRGDGHSKLFFVAGAALLPGDRMKEEHVSLIETDAMSAALENLFAITPHRYCEGNVITLERGRVGLKPSMPVAGRAIGGW